MNSRVVILIGAILLLLIVAFVTILPTTRQVSLGEDIKPTPSSVTIDCIPEVGIGAFILRGFPIRMNDQEYREYCE